MYLRVAILLLLVATGCRRNRTTPPTFPPDMAAPTADLILLGGRVVTVDSVRPEAQAVAIQGDRIVGGGSSGAVRRLVGSRTRVVDLGGRLLIPGFIEGHGHYLGLGESKTILDLTTARSWYDIVTMVRDAAGRARPGEWI